MAGAPPLRATPEPAPAPAAPPPAAPSSAGPSPDGPFPAADELHRLAALYGSGLLDPGPRATLDALTATAAALLDVPAVMLTLVDRDRLLVRSSTVPPPPPLAREVTMCDHAIRSPDGLVIPDLAGDPRFAAGPLVAEGLRFYAGVPVHAPDAAGRPRPIGALCVVDTVPRPFDAGRQASLRRLAGLADVLIAAQADARAALGIALEHQRLMAELARHGRVFAQAERLTGIGSWRLTLADEAIEWSEGVFRIYGLPPGAAPGLAAALDPYPPEARGRVAAHLARAIEAGEPFDFEEDFHPATGERRRVRCLGECERENGRPVALVGVFQDVTEAREREAALRRDADTDALTGLLNRAAFDRLLPAAITRARAGATPLVLALVDLDGFKAVNDTLGHAAGDEVLRQAGAALRALALPAPAGAAVAARIGGDEFALLAEGGDADALAAALVGALRFTAQGDGLVLACGGSVGVATLADEAGPREFVRRADVALYAAKRARVGERRRPDRRAAG